MSDSRAHAAVTKAIRDGVLPPVTTRSCVDCGAVATAYDHYKGYARENWLDVEPVCTRHNVVRSKSDRPSSTSDVAAVLLRVPRYLLDGLDAEAFQEHRSRTQQLNWILKQRYANASPTTTSGDDREGEKTDDRYIRESGDLYIRRAA